MIMRMKCNELFNVSSDRIHPKVNILLRDINLSPNVSFSSNVDFGEIHLSDYLDKDFEVEMHDNVHVITAIYDLMPF